MQVRSADDIQQLGTIMCVFAHPDDETFTMGGIIAAACQNGQEVICITATKGELGVQDEARWPAATLGETRSKELLAAFEILGIKQQYWLDCPDGSCADADEEVNVARIAELIRQHNPDTIFTFGPDGLTGHPDHQTISTWAEKSRKRAGSTAPVFHSVQTAEQYANSQVVDDALNFFYNTPKPPVFDDKDCTICLHLNDGLFATKIRALRAMPSQYQIMFEKFEEGALKGCFGVEAFRLKV